MLKSIRKSILSVILGGLTLLNVGVSCSKQNIEERAVEDSSACVQFQPDYGKTLESVIVTHKAYPQEVVSVDENYYKFIRREANNGIKTRTSIIEQLPKYSKVFLICDKESEPLFRAELGKLDTSLQEKVSVSVAEMPFLRDAFAQDLGAADGTNLLLRADYPYLASNLAAFGFNVVTHPSFGDGWGNKLLARNKKGEKIVFVGSTLAETDSKSLGKNESGVKEMYSRTFSADRTVIIPNVNTHADLEMRSLIHLDQVMNFAGDGAAIVARMPDRTPKVSQLYDGFLREFGRAKNKELEKREIMDYFALGYRFSAEGRQYIPVLFTPDSLRDKLTESQFKIIRKYGQFLGLFYHEYVSRKLESHEKALRDNGFDVDYLKMDLLNVALKQSVLNMNVFTDKESQKRSVLFPIFGPINRYEPKGDTGIMILRIPESKSNSVYENEGQFIAGVAPVYFGERPKYELEQENIMSLKKQGLNLSYVSGEDLKGGTLHCMMLPVK